MNIKGINNVAGSYRAPAAKKAIAPKKMENQEVTDKVTISDGKKSWGGDGIVAGVNALFGAAIGTVVGVAGGAVAGGVIGSSMGGPLGAAIGGIGGALVGGAGGFLAGIHIGFKR